jgi:hypothetical protein
MRVGRGPLATRRVIGAALVGAVLAGCAAPLPDPSARQSADNPVAPTPSSTPATPVPTARPARPSGYVPFYWANYGSHATVVVGKLNVRTFPGLDQAMISARFTPGASLFITDGPIPVDGYWWYEVEFDTSPFPALSGGYRGGWVAGQAGAATSDPADDEWLIRLGPINCPTKVDMPLLVHLSPWAVSHCARGVDHISGVIDDCDLGGPYVPRTYEPGWAYRSCPFVLRDELGSWYFSVVVAPDASVPDVERGDLVTLIGGYGIDTAKYGACLVTEGDGERSAETLTAKWQHDCQNLFVVTGGTIDGHVELVRHDGPVRRTGVDSTR